jgi:hypothetical protein
VPSVVDDDRDNMAGGRARGFDLDLGLESRRLRQ